MRRLWLLIYPLVILLSSCSTSSPIDEERLAKSKTIAQAFGQTLMAKLQSAMEDSGPTGAISVCKVASQEMEEQFSASDPALARVRRIALRTRNPQTHTPTSQEAEWLTAQEELIRANPEHEPQPYILKSPDRTTVLLPIVLSNPLCLVCHGDPENMPDDLIEALQSNYPNDRATGYQLGDFRGAIAIEWKH
jgi:hypothetical protein